MASATLDRCHQVNRGILMPPLTHHRTTAEVNLTKKINWGYRCQHHMLTLQRTATLWRQVRGYDTLRAENGSLDPAFLRAPVYTVVQVY